MSSKTSASTRNTQRTPRWRHALPAAIMLVLILDFWGAGITNLDRFPKVYEDESWVAAPGYTFWMRGEFGTDLFAGFYGMDKHDYQMVPLLPVLVGGGLHLFGLGLFQAR